MRTFLTSLANLEISYLEENCHVPNGVVSYEEGGHLIQEGADNVDINTEAIDGKNTFHSMARAIFQLQENTTNTKLSCVKVVRGHTRSLNLDDAKTVFLLESQNSVMDHRVVKKCKNEVITLSLIKKLKILELTWVFLRQLARQNALHIPTVVQFKKQIVPFWTGVYERFSKSCSEYTFVAYAPVIDAKSNDMATVYNAMKQCSNMAKKVGQPFSVQMFDQQLYAIAQQVNGQCQMSLARM